MVPNQPLPKTFLHESCQAQAPWLEGRPCHRLVSWMLKNRHLRWERMASQRLQRRLLWSSEALAIPGVIYSLVFPSCNSVYIGQTANSAWHRWKQHLQARWKDYREGRLQRVLQDDYVAAHALVIPLEVVPMAGTQREGHHSDQYIAEFRGEPWSASRSGSDWPRLREQEC